MTSCTWLTFFFLLLPCRIYCLFLSSRSCVSTWLAPLFVATSGSQKKDSSPALCQSVHSMLRWVCFSIYGMHHIWRLDASVYMADWFLRSIIMLVKIWLTGETPLLLSDITERRSGKSNIQSASCWLNHDSIHYVVVNSDFLLCLGCTLPTSMLWTTLGTFWKNEMS